MKKSDIATIILIASISVIAAYFAANAIIGNPNGESVTVKTANKITSDLEPTSSDVFYKDAINPTVEVEIGNR